MFMKVEEIVSGLFLLSIIGMFYPRIAFAFLFASLLYTFWDRWQWLFAAFHQVQT